MNPNWKYEISFRYLNSKTRFMDKRTITSESELDGYDENVKITCNDMRLGETRRVAYCMGVQEETGIRIMGEYKIECKYKK